MSPIIFARNDKTSSFTVLEANEENKNLSKTHIKDILTNKIETVQYSKIKYFICNKVNFNSFDKMAGLLSKYQNNSDVCIIRGEPNFDFEHFQTCRNKEKFDPFPRNWGMFDYDQPYIVGDPSLIDDPYGAVKAVLSRCPNDLKNTSCWWQLGNSAGIKNDKYSIHFWVMFNDAVNDYELEAYYKKYNFDVALANPIQIHYIAKPNFINMDDPVKLRSGIYIGNNNLMDVTQIKSLGKDADIKRRYLNIMNSYKVKKKSSLKILTSNKELMAHPKFKCLVFEECEQLLKCECPVHKSSSKKSLNVFFDGQWRCWGCNKSGGTTYSLALFLCKGDKNLASKILNESKKT